MNNEQELRIHTAVAGTAKQTRHRSRNAVRNADDLSFECSKVAVCRLSTFSDISKYYPTSYYSYAVRRPSLEYPQAPIPALRVKLLNEILSLALLREKECPWKLGSTKIIIGWRLSTWVRRRNSDLGLRSNSPILDVGAGAGKLLLDLNVLPQNLTGVDPH
jgi:hypothetical protein